jgi:hypothetical protein
MGNVIGNLWAVVYNVVGIPLAAAGRSQPDARRRGDGVIGRQRRR